MSKQKLYKSKSKSKNKNNDNDNDNDKMNRNKISIWQGPNNKIMKICYMKMRISNLNLFLLLLVSRMVQAKSQSKEWKKICNLFRILTLTFNKKMKKRSKIKSKWKK